MRRREPAESVEAEALYKAVEPYYQTIIDHWAEVQQRFGDEDALLVIDVDGAQRGAPYAVIAYPRLPVVDRGGSINHPSVPEGQSLQFPEDVTERVARPPGTVEGFTRSFWVVAFNVGGTNGTCGCLRLSVDAGGKYRPN
jgi:hypothetical protein